MAERWDRRAKYSLDPGNKRQAEARAAEWRESVEKMRDSDIMYTTERKEDTAVQTIGRIDTEKYNCITGDITTDEVIITDERIRHIEEHHPGDFEIIEPFLQAALDDPDYILKDADKTGLVLKLIEEENLRCQIVLRIQTSTDPDGFKNSILSAWRISESCWENYIRNKIILYKRE